MRSVAGIRVGFLIVGTTALVCAQGLVPAFAAAPTVPTITASPSEATPDTTAEFAFTDQQQDATFECALDGSAFDVCTSPMDYAGLSDGAHEFDVRAVDPATGDPSGASSILWHVDTSLLPGIPCTIVGTEGDDTLSGTSGADVICGLGGNDTILGYDGNDILEGGPGNDSLDGGLGNDQLNGGPGDDQLEGGHDINGDDTATFAAAKGPIVADMRPTEPVVTGDGSDHLSSIENITGSQYDDLLIGNSDVNSLRGLGGNDEIHGEGKGDTLLGGPGDDALYGDDGEDRVSFADSLAPVSVDLGAGTATGQGNDTLSGIEDVYGSPLGDHLTGDGGANVISGGAGNDVIDGAGGNDTLYGGAGDDRISGGSGSDTVFYSNAPGPVRVDLSAGSASGDGSDTLTQIEKVVGSKFDDVLVGDDGANVLQGGDGNDQLKGRGGTDVLRGGNGNDGLWGGQGRDVLDGGPGADTAYFNGDGVASGVAVDLATGTANNAELGWDSFAMASGVSTVENVEGSPFNDTITGDAQANLLIGGGGDDVISGGAGGDSLYGSAGNDTLNGNDGNDIIRPGPGDDAADGGAGVNTLGYDDLGSADGVSVDLATGTTSGAAGSDAVTNFGIVYGSAGPDVLYGSSGNDVLVGLGGADSLFGREGNDVLNLRDGVGGDSGDGGPGDDRCVTDAGDSVVSC